MTERPDGPILSNPRSDRIRAIRALSGRSVRERAGRFLVEGPQAVREAVRTAAVDEVLIGPMAAERHPEISHFALDSQIPVRRATSEVIEAISSDAQGVVAVGSILRPTLHEVLPTTVRLIVVLHENQDPGNAGTIIRTADAAGADAVVMTRGSVDIYNPKVVRSTAGSLFHIPVVTGLSLGDALSALKENSLQILAADGSGTHDLDDLQDRKGATRAPDLSQPTAWLFGNEARGLSPSDVLEAHASVAVPIHGQAESLNLATAAAICLYASARAQRRCSAAQSGE